MEQPKIWFQNKTTLQWNQYSFRTIDSNHIEINLKNQLIPIDLQTTEVYYVNHKPILHTFHLI